eukprot:1147496-Pelagomonas_calceolata.AAC.2
MPRPTPARAPKRLGNNQHHRRSSTSVQLHLRAFISVGAALHFALLQGGAQHVQERLKWAGSKNGGCEECKPCKEITPVRSPEAHIFTALIDRNRNFLRIKSHITNRA